MIEEEEARREIKNRNGMEVSNLKSNLSRYVRHGMMKSMKGKKGQGKTIVSSSCQLTSRRMIFNYYTIYKYKNSKDMYTTLIMTMIAGAPVL